MDAGTRQEIEELRVIEMVEEESVMEQPEETHENSEEKEKEDLSGDIEDLRKKLEEKADISEIVDIRAWKLELESMLESMRSEMDGLKKENSNLYMQIRELTDILTEKNDEIRRMLDDKVDDGRVRTLRKDFSKMNKKLVAVMEETGFGEIIDVTKIPPNILEIVYDSTLKDISLALWREYGPGAERVIMDTLEKIRLETSGSEMFHYDGRYIVTRDVAKNIKRGMISAKQLQDTYEALLKALSEMVPTYKHKNFKAMIKLKSQEYTVDKTTFLLEKVEKMEENLTRIDEMLSSVVRGLSSQAERISELDRKLHEDMDLRFSKEIERYDAALSGMESGMADLKERFDSAFDSMEKRAEEKEALIASLEERLSHLESRFPEPETEKEETEEKSAEVEEPDMENMNEEEKLVLSAISEEGVTYAKLKRSVSALISAPLDEILSSLSERRLIFEKKRGKTRKFFPVSADEKRPENVPEGETGSDEESSEKEKKILESVPERGCTLNRLKKTLGKSMEGREVEEIVNILVDKEYLVKTTRGRYTIYMKNKEKIGGEKDA